MLQVCFGSTIVSSLPSDSQLSTWQEQAKLHHSWTTGEMSHVEVEWSFGEEEEDMTARIAILKFEFPLQKNSMKWDSEASEIGS